MAALAWRASLDHRVQKAAVAALVRRVSEAKMAWGCQVPLAHLVPLGRSSTSQVRIGLWQLCRAQRAEQDMLVSRAQWDRRGIQDHQASKVHQG